MKKNTIASFALLGCLSLAACSANVSYKKFKTTVENKFVSYTYLDHFYLNTKVVSTIKGIEGQEDKTYALSFKSSCSLNQVDSTYNSEVYEKIVVTSDDTPEAAAALLSLEILFDALCDSYLVLCPDLVVTSFNPKPVDKEGNPIVTQGVKKAFTYNISPDYYVKVVTKTEDSSMTEHYSWNKKDLVLNGFKLENKTSSTSFYFTTQIDNTTSE